MDYRADLLFNRFIIMAKSGEADSPVVAAPFVVLATIGFGFWRSAVVGNAQLYFHSTIYFPFLYPGGWRRKSSANTSALRAMGNLLFAQSRRTFRSPPVA